MRAAILMVAVLFTASPASAWLAERAADRQAFDVLVRRVEAIKKAANDPKTKESCRKCLYLLDAIYARRGQVPEGQEIVLDTKDEERLIMALTGMAKKAMVRASFWKEKWNGWWRLVWKKVKSALWHWLPLAPILVWLWCSRKRLWRAVCQWDRSTDRLPEETRRQFKGKDLERVHAKLRG